MAEYDVVILGAGLGGLGLGANLKQQAKFSFLLLEQASGVGGTWRDNVYPGAACDVESHLYCFSFAPHVEASRIYSRQPEILRYAERIVRDNGLEPNIRVDSRVTSATWSDSERHWTIEIENAPPVTARCFVAAWGQLNRPQVPNIKGIETFGGAAFHSARWQELDWAGKRVGSIGNAASAVQYIPEIAPKVGHLSVFQRSPNWVVPRVDHEYSTEERERFADDLPFFETGRQAMFDDREALFQRMRQGTDQALEAEAVARAHLANHVSDPELRRKLTPDYPLGCKRVLRSSDYYPALARDNVDLVTAPISEVVKDGIVTADGVLHPLDVIIFGTGFETQTFQGPVEITGAGGASLRAFWKDGVRAYLGMGVPHFPNFFMLYGPNTNLGHNSILTMLEAQFAYIQQAIALGLDKPIAPRAVALEEFDAQVQGGMEGLAWAGDCSSWYKDANGRVVNNWVGSVREYQRLTASIDPEAYETI